METPNRSVQAIFYCGRWWFEFEFEFAYEPTTFNLRADTVVICLAAYCWGFLGTFWKNPFGVNHQGINYSASLVFLLCLLISSVEPVYCCCW